MTYKSMKVRSYSGEKDKTGHTIDFEDSISTFFLHDIQMMLDKYLTDAGYKPLPPCHIFNYVASRKFTAWMRQDIPGFSVYDVNSHYSGDLVFYLRRVIITNLKYSMGNDVKHVKLTMNARTADKSGLVLLLTQKTKPAAVIEITPMEESALKVGEGYLLLTDSRIQNIIK